MIVDFKEIEDKSGFIFERFIEDLLKARGWRIILGAGQGPDGGRDITASINETFGTGKDKERKYLIQCKHYAHSNKTVTPGDITDFSLMPQKHGTKGWLLITSTKVSENVVQNINAANKEGGVFFDYWDAREIEKQVLFEDCREVLKRYFPNSYARNTHLIIPALIEVQELVTEWQNHFRDYASNFVVTPEIEKIIYSSIASERVTLKEAKELLFSESLVSDFMDIWMRKLKKGQEPGEMVLLILGLKQLQNLRNKGLPDRSIEKIVTDELALTAHHRDMKRKHWQKFLVHKGQNYDWTSFKVQHGQSYTPTGIPLCGLNLIVYCENYGEAASGVVKIEGEEEEARFVASYQLESNLKFHKFPLNIPFSINYKLDDGSDPVLFLSVGFAVRHGIEADGRSNITWNRLV